MDVALIHIFDRERIFHLLKKLEPNAQPIFGIMTPQHMVEHLAWAIGFSNGNSPQQLHFAQEIADRIKSVVVYSDMAISPGFKAPVMPRDELMPLQYPDLSTAIHHLQIAMEDFNLFFEKHPHAKPVNPTMGILDHQEWIVFHNKHITHHFKQFGLL